MRILHTLQGYFDFSRKSSVKVVQEYRAEYEAIDRVLGANAKIGALAHRDFSKFLSVSEAGRESEYTSEEILRSLVVMFIERDSYRDAVVRIENSEFLRRFVGLGIKPMMDYSFLSKAFGVLSEETWQAINAALGRYAKREEKISAERLRVDTTVYETNIHYPTDSSLLWDSFRTLARLLRQVKQELPQLGLGHRFHPKKVKKLAYFIARNGGSCSKRKQRKVKSTYQALIERVRWIAEAGRETLGRVEEAGYEVPLLEHYLPLVERIVHQATQRVLEGVQLPVDEKLYSLFEEHTELIKRGKAAKPVEFGHKVLVAQSGEKFITHYEVFPKRREDKDLLDGTLQAHRKLFGTLPAVLAADKGFYASRTQLRELEKKIEMVSLAKKGRRTGPEIERESTEAFKEGQRFRAGSEGSISVLKRAFKLNRCLFKGFKNYAASVGCAVFCHNLVLLARL
jgi:IS5 family transposase